MTYWRITFDYHHKQTLELEYPELHDDFSRVISMTHADTYDMATNATNNIICLFTKRDILKVKLNNYVKKAMKWKMILRNLT